MGDITFRVAYRHLLAKALLRNNRGRIEVSGTPAELQELRGSLRSLGFKQDPLRRVWYTGELDPQRRKGLERLLAWYGKSHVEPRGDWSNLILEVGGV